MPNHLNNDHSHPLAEPCTDSYTTTHDPLYHAACQYVLLRRRASVSLLQLHFGIGYRHAIRLLEAMEADNLVTAADDQEMRKILFTQYPTQSVAPISSPPINQNT